jgi:hypothetical protein
MLSIKILFLRERIHVETPMGEALTSKCGGGLRCGQSLLFIVL